MKETTKKIIEELVERYPLSDCKADINGAFLVLDGCIKSGGTIFVCGNGGSAADSEHIVGELMKKFKKDRPLDPQFVKTLQMYGKNGQMLAEVLEGGLRAVSLTSHLSLTTAFANDKCPQAAFAQQLSVLGREGDALIAISTSGNSENCVLAATVAKAMGISVVALTGHDASGLARLCDVCVHVPEKETYKVQELHLPIYHCLCAMLEEENF